MSMIETPSRGKSNKDIVWKTLVVTATLICVAISLYVLYAMRSVVGMAAFAALVAYALNPIVSLLQRVRIGRTASIIIVTAAITVGVLVSLLFVVPAAYREVADLLRGFPEYFRQFRMWIDDLWVHTFQKPPPSDLDSVLDMLAPDMQSAQSLASKVMSPIGRIISGTFTSIAALIAWIVTVAMVPVVVFYFLRDGDRLSNSALALVPLRMRGTAVRLHEEITHTLGAFVRGQLLVALILSALYGIGFYIIGVPRAIFFGCLSGFANLIPYFSLVIGLIPTAIVAAVHFGSWVEPLYVLLVFAVVQTLEGTVITPKIVGEKVGLHPLLVILAIFIGGTLGGFVGIILAVPIAAVVKVIFKHALTKARGTQDDEVAGTERSQLGADGEASPEHLDGRAAEQDEHIPETDEGESNGFNKGETEAE